MNIQNLVIGTVAIAVVGFIGHKGIETIKQNNSYITTNGLSDRYVVSDSAIWTLQIAAEGKNIKEAQEKMKADTDTVLKFLKKEGIKDEEITNQTPKIEDRYRWGSGSNEKSLPRFRVFNMITIKTQRLEQAEKAQEKTTELLENNIDIENNFRYFYKDIAKLRIDMIKEATLDSENRANNIAETLNKQVTGLRHLHTGRFAIYAEDVSITQDYASEWTEEKSKKKRIRIIVTGTYNLKS